METTASSRRPVRPYMMAMVLGTALTTFSPALAQTPPSPDTQKAVADLSRYCTACWRNARLPADAWNDCTQEVLCRLLQRVPLPTWSRILKAESEEHREFVRAIDAVKKRTQRKKRASSAGLELASDQARGQRERLADERAAVHQAASELLSPRQQNILQMAFEGWSVQEISRRLDLSAARISDEKYKAIQKLRAHLTRDVAG